jgi:uroporphyrinogen-III synthase
MIKDNIYKAACVETWRGLVRMGKPVEISAIQRVLRMSDELAGRRIVVPETRELALFQRMLEERGAICTPCPMIAIHDAPDSAPVEAWVRRFIARPSDDLILLTGEGLRRLIALADRKGLRDPFVASLAKSRRITRGPKPVRALREIGLDGDLTRRVGVQLYPDSAHEALLGHLEASAASVDPVLPYVYASSAEDALVVATIDEMAAGKIDAIAFTSGPQVRRLSAVAEKTGRSEALRTALSHVVVAAVGPIVAAELEAFGVKPSVVPSGDAYFMKPLARALTEAFAPPKA